MFGRQAVRLDEAAHAPLEWRRVDVAVGMRRKPEQRRMLCFGLGPLPARHPLTLPQLVRSEQRPQRMSKGRRIARRNDEPHSIAHREYYQLLAFFNNVDEPEIELPNADIARRRAELEAQIAARVADLANQFPAYEAHKGETRPVEVRRQARLEIGVSPVMEVCPDTLPRPTHTVPEPDVPCCGGRQRREVERRPERPGDRPQDRRLDDIGEQYEPQSDAQLIDGRVFRALAQSTRSPAGQPQGNPMVETSPPRDGPGRQNDRRDRARPPAEPGHRRGLPGRRRPLRPDVRRRAGRLDPSGRALRDQ